jgi:formylmethanofuran dehydrogenase subunit C
MNAMTRSRTGMALPMVLGAIVLIGTLVAGVMYLATQDYRVGANTLNETQAAATAEMGLNRLTTDWDLTRNTSMATGDTVRKLYTDPNGTVANVLLTRMNGNFFWAVSEAQTRGNSVQYGARRRFGGLIRLNTPNVNFLGAVTAAGNIRVSGNVNVNGMDSVPSGWTGCGPATNMPGSVITPTATTTVNGSVTINGNPPYTTNAAAGDTNTYFNYGSSTYTALAAAADITLPTGTYTGMGPVAVGTICTKSSTLNWGDPVRHSPAAACETYFPVIHVTGDLKASGGTGQGILLVDGDFTKAGNFNFTGVVIARGTIRSTGSNNGVTGVEMAAAVDLGDAVTLAGSTKIQYSSCAVARALSASSYPVVAKGRAWVNLY